MSVSILFCAFALGMVLGAALVFHITADTYDSALDESYQNELQWRHQVDELEDEIERLELRPVHCPAPIKVTQIGIDWDELDFPNSSDRR